MFFILKAYLHEAVDSRKKKMINLN